MKNNLKANLKSMRPYIIFNTFIFSILGAIIGKNLVEIRNTSRKLNADNEALEKYLGGLVKAAEENDQVVQLADLEKLGEPKDPVDPTVIYVYD